LTLRHRHLHAVGITIVWALQTFKGLTRALRLNTCQFGLWKTLDKSEQEAMFEEIAGVCSKEQFFALFKQATQKPHDFLWCDLVQPDETKVFRQNFDGPYLQYHGPEDEEAADQLAGVVAVAGP
jgi:hypothetical protein